MSVLLFLAAAATPCPFIGKEAKMICADKGIAAKKAWLDEAFARWLDLDTRKAAIRARRAEFEREWAGGLRDWSSIDGQSPPKAEVAAFLDGQMETLALEFAANENLTPSPDPASLARAECHANYPENCAVRSSGYLNDAGGKPLLMWQHLFQNGAGPASNGMLVVWDISGERAREVGHVVADGVFEAPRLTEFDETMLLHLPVHAGGTGWGNRDALFERRAGNWVNIDMESWKADIPKHAPKGLGLWKGVDYDFDGMSVSVPLWKPDDGNCCPTGGAGEVRFEIRNDALVIADWTYSAPEGGK